MKFLYVLSKQNKLVEIARVNDEKFLIVTDLVKLTPVYLESILVRFSLDQLSNRIREKIQEREKTPVDIPEFDSVFFSEDYIFEYKEFEGKTMKLCRTGFDNTILFLINIFESVKRSGEEHYLFFAKNHKEFRMKFGEFPS